MSKIVKTVAIIAVATAIVVFAPQIAGFIGASGIFGATVTAATITALTSAAVGIGLSIGLTAAMGLFRKVPNLSQAMADRLSTQIRPTAPRRIIFGLTAAGADVRFEQTHDLPSTKKDGNTEVVALASHRINAVKSWSLEDVVTWTPGGLQGEYRSGIPFFRVVTEGSSANSFNIPNTLWTTSSTFTGCAYYAVTFKLDADVFPQNPPIARTTLVEGCPLYDPRLDGSRGGSGPHRADNQATWAYYNGTTEIGRNPALALLTYLLGYRINGKLAWGMGVPIDRINLANFRAYANICEERVTLQTGGTIQRYTCDGAFSTGDTHETVIGAITASMGSCKLIDSGGIYGLIGGYDDTAGPKVSLTSDDILEGGYQWVTAPPQRESYNIARGQFCDAAQQFQLSDWGEVRTNPLADGYDRTLVIDLGCVTRAETAQRIAKQHLLREAKTPGVFSATFGPKAFAAEVGSLVTLSGPENWNNKLFRVLDQAETHDMIYQMTLREESAEVYAWDKEEKPLPTDIRPPGYDPKDTISPTNLRATTTSIQGANQVNISVIDISWNAEASGRVQAIEIQSRTTGVAWTALTTGADPKTGTFRFQSNVPGVQVEIQARFRMTSGVVSPWVSTNIATQAITSVDGQARETAGTAITRANGALTTANTANTNATTALTAVTDPATGQPYSLKQIADDVQAAAKLADLESERQIAIAREEVIDAKAVAAKTQADLAKVTADTAGGAVNDLKLAVRSRPNLVPNGGFERGMEGWGGEAARFTTTPSGWGTYAYPNNKTNWPTTGAITSPRFPVYGNVTYTISGDSALFSNAGGCSFDIIFYDANGVKVGDSAEKILSGRHDFSDAVDARNTRHAIAVVAPAGSFSATARFVWSGTDANPDNVCCRYIKVEQGGMPSTPYTSEATLAETNAKFSDRVALLTRADEALAGRATTLETSLNTPVTGVIARITNEETTRANAVSALAGRTSFIEARTQNTLPNQLINGDFKDGTNRWAANGPYGIGNASSIGTYANLPGANALYIYTDVRVDAGVPYSISAEGHGHNCNAFVYGQFINEARNAVIGTTPQISFNAANYTRKGSPETFCPTGATWLRVIAQKDASAADGYLNITRIAVQNGAWTYWRDDASIRDTTARITSEETTRSNQTSALSNRADALEASVNTPNTGILARLTKEETARADQTSALASRATTLEAKINNRPNLQNNGGFERRLEGLSNLPSTLSVDVNNPLWGTHVAHRDNGVRAIYMPAIRAVPGAIYAISFDSVIFAASGTVRVDVACYTSADGTGVETGYAGSSAFKHANTDFRDNARDEFQVTIPSGINSMRIRLISEEVTGASIIGFRRIKVERGTLPSTPFTPEGTVETAFARINEVDVARADQTSAVAIRTTNLETAVSGPDGLTSKVSSQAGSISDLYGRNAAWFVVDAVAGNNRAQLRVVADANRGAGVDIVGDLSVSGNLLVGGSVSTGKVTGNAITKTYYTENSGAVNIPNGSETTILSLQTVKDENDSAVQFNAVIYFASSDDIRGQLTLYCNGIALAARQVYLNGAGRTLILPVPFIWRLVGWGGGVCNFQLNFTRTGGANTVLAENGTCMITQEVKR